MPQTCRHPLTVMLYLIPDPADAVRSAEHRERSLSKFVRCCSGCDAVGVRLGVGSRTPVKWFGEQAAAEIVAEATEWNRRLLATATEAA